MGGCTLLTMGWLIEQSLAKKDKNRFTWPFQSRHSVSENSKDRCDWGMKYGGNPAPPIIPLGRRGTFSPCPWLVPSPTTPLPQASTHHHHHKPRLNQGTLPFLTSHPHSIALNPSLPGWFVFLDLDISHKGPVAPNQPSPLSLPVLVL